MHITLEEEIVLLYTLYVCGRRPSKGQATQFIITNNLLKEKQGDSDVVSTGESRIENRIAWIRANLKTKSQLSNQDHGIWAITQKGVDGIEKIAVKSLEWEEPDKDDEVSAILYEIRWDRFSEEFIKRLKILGAELKRQQAAKGK